MTTEEIEFREAIARSGLTPPDQIMADGKIHRFASNGKRSDDAGWYIFYPDGVAAGAYGCWRTDLKGSWRANIGRPLTSAEEKASQTKVDAARRERAREEARRHAEARDEAGLIWKASKPAPSDHPYLVEKGVKPHGVRVHDDGALVVPMRDGAELHSLQFIGADGHKRFLTGGRVAGCYFSVGSPKGAVALCICEGFATGASIHEAAGYPVVVTFNAGNLLPVAKAMHKRFPELHLIVCADDDAETPGNPGRTKATGAAQAVGGAVAIPDFGSNRPECASDFNDLHRHAGLQAVRDGIKRAAHGAPTFITAAALWHMQHAPARWAVPGILPEGVTILAGKPKIGKSWLALDLAIAVGTGGLALGAIDVEAGPVLFLALEDTKRRLTKRLRILCGNTTPPPEQIEFLTACPRLGSGGEEVLRTWLREHPSARLLAIDTLPRFRPPANAKESPYANDYIVGEYLSRLCMDFQVSILLLGHTRKQPGDDPIDEISGTFGLVGSVDGYMVLRRQAMSDDVTLYVCGRDVDDPAEHCIAWDRDRARWSITGGDPRVSRLPPEQRRVYELLSEDPKTITELTEELHPGHVVTDPRADQKYKNASKLVYKLRDRDLLLQRAFDKRWATSKERMGGTERTGGAERTGGTEKACVPPCSPSCQYGEGEHEPLSGAGLRDCSPSSPCSPDNDRTCPSCAGAGCNHCGGMGRIVDDEPQERRA